MPRAMPRTVALFLPLAVALLVLAPRAAQAADEATHRKRFPASSVGSISLRAAVGAVRIEQGGGDQVGVSVTLKAKRTTGIFSALPDVSDLEIASTTRGDQLTLKVDANNIEERWVIRLPQKRLSAIELKLGVGDVEVLAPVRRFDIDVGVGDVNIDIPGGAIAVTVGTGDVRIRTKLADAGSIRGKAGVGSVELNGAKGTTKGSTVGGSVTAEGKGKQPIEVTVGVGDLTVNLID